MIENDKTSMKRPLDVDDDGESGSDYESASEMESVAGSTAPNSLSKASHDQGRGSKNKERNRMHSKLTRLRRVSRVNQMKERLLELQTETTRLEQLFDELNTANILLCLRVNMPPNTIDEINSLSDAPSDLHQSKTFDTRENIMDQLKERVRAEAEILREKFHSSQAKPLYHGDTVDYTGGESETLGKDLEKKERNRIHAKLTRVRRKLLTNEVQEAIQHLEAKNLIMHSKLDALIRSNLDSLNILVVDDVSTIRKTTKKMLENSGFNVVISQNGAEAVKIMNESQFDVVLMDLQMPVMDGIEAMKAIRNKERQQMEQLINDFNSSTSTMSSDESSCRVVTVGDTTALTTRITTGPPENTSSTASSMIGSKKQTFIIALSAFSDEVTLAETYQAGADAFIAKPFNLSLFKETLQSLMTMTT
mmetsp:Transcript_1543/g.2148  ORF Transcript_1543/g.2148 Transcript_1543/m.2148 type:complete len:421 (-) Transcript_1543:1507-2769(-)|eukprot:CAMPEP_0170116688 /NCGR_PEP_ID=MMETSP0020_2-20130122/12456_1 /TAXON_ID=98059 /ORGANISM="Dinobryon sp., Strain UTEXLB2267" /LENGTH=420 /DNA_ID=CAMNT_0010344929 /DNA_START=98 /DNA_END=1360 /DNA_ORIENTATION=-